MSLVRTLRILASQRPSRPARAVAAPSRVTRQRSEHVPVTWIDQELAGSATIVHLHGGSYLYGESRNCWAWLEEVARRSGAAAAMVHYRLPPRHPFPAAVEDVLSALDGLAAQGSLRPGGWVLSGDSAGGGLALAVAQLLAESGADEPAALLLESPWADLTREDRADPELQVAARLYAGAVPREDARLSPLFGDLSDLPPVHLVTGSEDDLVGDSRGVAAALSAAGAAHDYLELPGAGHDPAVNGTGPAAQEARRFQIAAVHGALHR